MYTVTFDGQEIECESGAVLRDVLLDAGCTPHNGTATTVNCHGYGSCGTCAVEVSGEVSQRGRRESARLSVPPHNRDTGLRLACQTRVQGDVTVQKYPGFWGQHTDSDPER
ncbi:2Fe-2S iron-sulfur cluster binding domain-containing protein [Halovenus salina]|uniref:2Fe-2S iron-sulfur cluster binding domain-containing protein n=1 Tax=Halovenus salina TaxID=1510225 RepID=A0ABD5W838_9EURY|nr:2Fe-2S iron-sulfur cluster binding domain-containing protein [Halovenus salina]